MSSKKPQTAADLQRELQRRPEYFQRRRERELREEESLARYRRAAAPIFAELQKLGYVVERIVDLGRDGRRYRAAVPVLLRWLPRVEEQSVRREIVRALTDPSARPDAALPLLELFEDSQDADFKWLVANAVAFTVDERSFERVVAGIRDRRHGRTRQPLLAALPRMPREQAVAVAVEALDDPDLTGHAVEALRKLKAVEAERDVARFVDHPTPWVRKEVAATLNALKRTRRARG